MHQYFHKLRRCHLRAKVGWGANPAIGVDEASLRRGPHGQWQWNVDFMDSLEAGCYALKTLRQHRQGNVVLWGWLTSGWLTKETLAQWKFEGDVEALAEIAQTEQVAPQYLQASSLAAGIRFRTCRMHKSGIGPSSYHQHAVFPSCADGVDTHSSAVLIELSPDCPSLHT